jgi:murein DD-endopeptidase MepM/ murein hydrolase activator NlpD
MFDFLKKIIGVRDKKVTFILMEEGSPDEPTSYTFLPKSLIRLHVFMSLSLVLILWVILKYTFLGGVVFNNQDPELRHELLGIGERILALQDSLLIRDQQLQNIKDILRTGQDTTFIVGRIREQMDDIVMTGRVASPIESRDLEYSFLKAPDVQFNVSSYSSQVLPAPFPVNGTITQGFKPLDGHFGIDIATVSGTMIRSIAEGVVISAEWTMNYGNVLHIQHRNGYLTIFKHITKPSIKVGDFVQKGDILGGVSEFGLISSGPHLHFEIWQNGTPLNPLNYLIN